jgi:hypothetical protein
MQTDLDDSLKRLVPWRIAVSLTFEDAEGAEDAEKRAAQRTSVSSLPSAPSAFRPWGSPSKRHRRKIPERLPVRDKPGE